MWNTSRGGSQMSTYTRELEQSGRQHRGRRRLKNELKISTRISRMARCVYCYGATPQLRQNVSEKRWVPDGNLNNLPSWFQFSSHDAIFCDLTLLFCRGKLRNVQKIKKHVLSYFSAHEIFCFVRFAVCSRSLLADRYICRVLFKIRGIDYP